MRGAVTVSMAAPPDAVWALVSDVTQIGKYSPETFEAVWLDGATGPALGARFRGHVKRNGIGPIYWTTCEVVACEPGREFAFCVVQGEKRTSTWRYVMEPSPSEAGGTDVTESFELLDEWWLRLYWKVMGWSRGKTNENGMRTTLERIRAVAEGDVRDDPDPS